MSWVRAATWIGVGLVGVVGCSDEAPPEAPAARPVRILELDGPGERTVLEYPGEISASQNADVAFEVAGRLVEFPVKESQRVERGQVLAKLDPRDYRAALDAAAAQAAAQKADWARYQALFEEDVISVQELERAKRNYEVAAAREKTAQKALEDTTLRAPFAGTVARKLVDDFANIQAKQSVVTLQTGSALEIVVNIPEQDFARIQPGATVDELNIDLVADVTVSAIPGRKFPATLKEFATTADPTTRTFRVTFSFEAPGDLNVVPGMTAKIVGRGRNLDPGGGFRIPVQAAVEDEGNRPYVWVLDPESMTVRKVPVTLGSLTGSSVEVTSGLSAGDQVVTSGVHQLQEGMEVRRMGG